MNFETEFERLGELANNDVREISLNCDHIFSSALSRENYDNNRYSNIMALEPTRVKVDRVHYINANFVEVDGQTWIATQAPLPNTFGSFWVMVWENRSPIIVMLTNLKENGKNKADVYWPTIPNRKTFTVYGFGKDIVVEQTSCILFDFAEIRQFKMTCMGETRLVRHILYREWPDFGTPSEVYNILKVLNMVDAHVEQSPGVPIVHCSAGVGRAGVFITLGILLSRENFDEQDVLNCVRQVRKCRLGAVQTPQQLEFLFKAAFEGKSIIHLKKEGYSRPAVQERFVSPLTMSSYPILVSDGGLGDSDD